MKNLTNYRSINPGVFCLGVLFTLSMAATIMAGRSSASYSIAADSTDTGGLSAQSASYSFNGSAIGEQGTANNAITTSAAYSGKPGYVGALYDLTGLSITAPPSSSLNENTSRQLAAAPLADDATTNAALSSSAVTWSIVTGPITSISASGLATAATVYQDTAATIGGTAQGLTGQLGLTILNVNTDDYGTYAGDGINDAWQVQYFGLPPNPMAGPNVDADGTGQTNLFKFVAGLNPLDHSRFNLSVVPVAGQPGQKNLVFTPIVSGRTYTPQFETSLTTPNWQTLTGSTQVDSGNQRTVTDTAATPVPKFYRGQITKP